MEPYLPWIIVVFTVLFVRWVGSRNNKLIQRLLNWLPAILLAYILPATISAYFGLDYGQHSIHSGSKLVLIPLAILSVMASMTLSQLKTIGWKPIVVFLAGSLWIAVFPVLYLLFFAPSELLDTFYIDLEYWKGLPPIVGSWIGGSTSQLVLKEVVDCPENVFLTILILDSILVNIWTLIMFQSVKRSEWINRVLKIKNSEPPKEIHTDKEGRMSAWWCLLIFALGIALVHYTVPSFIVQVVVLSLLGLVLGNAIKPWNSAFSLRLGEVAILFVMAILGLKLRFELISFESHFIGFLVLWLLGHFVFMLLCSKLLRVNTAWVSIASMANVGGIATAPAVTAAYKREWMPHAIVLAILSMATGTFWGLLTIFLIENWVI